jgi:hypothetical protein
MFAMQFATILGPQLEAMLVLLSKPVFQHSFKNMRELPGSKAIVEKLLLRIMPKWNDI